MRALTEPPGASGRGSNSDRRECRLRSGRSVDDARQERVIVKRGLLHVGVGVRRDLNLIVNSHDIWLVLQTSEPCLGQGGVPRLVGECLRRGWGDI